MNNKQKKTGFTLIELIIVVTIISVLTTVAYTTYSQYIKDAENERNKAEINNAQSEIEFKNLKDRAFPSSEIY
jgi:prepilin-type N-terminal cleavage/methylation domain-containing protein